jgi:hypothetical protein
MSRRRARRASTSLLPIAFLALALDVRPLDAQRPTRAATSTHVSVMGGGMLVGDSRLALGKVSLEGGRWALMLDLTRDDTRERWAVDDSRGDYVLWGRSAQLRRYTRDAGRGFFIEGGGGTARASLRVTDALGARVDRAATVPMATWGIGGRFGVGASASFVEVGYRSVVVLRERHLHTAETPPDGSTRDFVTYQSWYFKRGRATGQPYVGFGLRF